MFENLFSPIGMGPLGLAWWDYVSRNWALVSILMTVAFLIVTSWAILRKYVKLMLNIIRDTPPPLGMGPRDFERIDGERVNFRAFDNLNLCGMFLFGHHGGQPKGMIIFSHEFSSDMYSCARYCRPLLASGYDVFSFDFRGHGESSYEPGYQARQWPSDREVNDMLGAIAYVEDWLEQQGRPVELGLFGISRGGGAAILAAQNNPAIKAIITDGAFSSDTTLEYFMKRWAYIFAKIRIVYENHPPQFWRFLRWLLFRECRRKLNCVFPSVRKALRVMHAPRPILFIHGQRDSYIPVEQSQLLYEAAPGPKSLWAVPGAKHNQSVIIRPEYYAARTVAFFNEYLFDPAHQACQTTAEPAALANKDRQSQPAESSTKPDSQAKSQLTGGKTVTAAPGVQGPSGEDGGKGISGA